MADVNPKPLPPREPQLDDEQIAEAEGGFCAIEPPSRSQGTSEARESMDRVRESAGQAGERGKEMAADLSARVQSKVYELLEHEKNRAADRLASLSHALREACENVEDENARALISYAKSGAEGVERASRKLHDRELRDMGDDLTRVARDRPELFLGASFLAGVALARVVKSTWGHERQAIADKWTGQTAPAESVEAGPEPGLQPEPGVEPGLDEPGFGVEPGPGPVARESPMEGPDRPAF